jgi:hypothetical protein
MHGQQNIKKRHVNFTNLLINVKTYMGYYCNTLPINIHEIIIKVKIINVTKFSLLMS